MQNKGGYLFTLDLRLGRQTTKLNVYENDSLNALFTRLSNKMQIKKEYGEKFKEKLVAEFKRTALD
jgi:hypothetical protein